MDIQRKKVLSYKPDETLGVEPQIIEEVGEPVYTEPSEIELGLLDASRAMLTSIFDIDSVISAIEAGLPDYSITVPELSDSLSSLGINSSTITTSIYKGMLLRSDPVAAEIVERFETAAFDNDYRPELNLLEPLMAIRYELEKEIYDGVDYIQSPNYYTPSVYNDRIHGSLELAGAATSITNQAKYILRADTYRLADCLLENIFSNVSSNAELMQQSAGALREGLEAAKSVVELSYILKNFDNLKVKELLRFEFRKWISDAITTESRNILGRAQETIIKGTRSLFDNFIQDSGCQPYQQFFGFIAELTSNTIEEYRKKDDELETERSNRLSIISKSVDNSAEQIKHKELIRSINQIINILASVESGQFQYNIPSMIRATIANHNESTPKFTIESGDWTEDTMSVEDVGFNRDQIVSEWKANHLKMIR